MPLPLRHAAPDAVYADACRYAGVFVMVAATMLMFDAYFAIISLLPIFRYFAAPCHALLLSAMLSYGR